MNIAARLVTGTPKFHHITPTLRRLHWLPVKQRIEFKVLLYVYKSIHNLSPQYISELIKVRSTTCTRSLRSTADSTNLYCPSFRLKSCGERSFMVAGPKLWNLLPLFIRESPSVTIFKEQLRTHLLLSL